MPTILYSDEYIAVAVKPAGMLSEGENEDCFPALLKRELSLKEIYTVHRLDRDTEGIMVYALTQKAAAALSSDIANGKWSKVYLALLCGRPEKNADRLCDMLYYDRKKNKSFVVDKERKGVKQALLSYEVKESFADEKALVRVELETGRTHQIRIQFASRGLPLCGDRRYGAPKDSGKNLALCAAELNFYHPVTKESMNFSISPTFI